MPLAADTTELGLVEAAKAMSKALDGAMSTVAGGVATLRPPVFSASSGSIRGAAVAVSAPGLPSNTQFYDAYTGYTKDTSLTNIFKLPNSASGISQHLMQLFDAEGNELVYTPTAPYFAENPASMSMLVEFKDASQGLEMELYMDSYPVVTNADSFMLPFEIVGTVTVALENLEIRINSAQTGVSKQGPTAEYFIEGMILEASLYQNSQPFKVDGKDVTLADCTFGTEGLKTGTVQAGGSDIGRFERDDTGLKLILKDESGNDEAPINIQ